MRLPGNGQRPCLPWRHLPVGTFLCPVQDIARDAAHILEEGLLAEEEPGSAKADGALAEHRQALGTAFSAFATFGLRDAAGSTPELDSFRCTKLVREAGLLDSNLTPQALDVLFAAAVAKERGVRRWGVQGGLGMASGGCPRQGAAAGWAGGKEWVLHGSSARHAPGTHTIWTTCALARLSFNAFLRLLPAVADKKGAPLSEVAAAVAATQAPAMRATTPEAVKLHDDRSLYTGGQGMPGLAQQAARPPEVRQPARGRAKTEVHSQKCKATAERSVVAARKESIRECLDSNA